MARSGKRRVPAQALPLPELGRKVPKKLVGVVPHDEGSDPKPVWGLSLLDHVDNAPRAVWPCERAGLEARARLEELGLDDFDELFRFRLGNMERLWGVFAGNNHVFYPLWWDCDHKVCP